MTSRVYHQLLDALTTATTEAEVAAVLGTHAPLHVGDPRWEDVTETAAMQVDAIRCARAAAASGPGVPAPRARSSRP